MDLGPADVESAINDLTVDYADTHKARPTRIRGDQGWREIEWDNGARHRYEWAQYEMDLRCDACRSPDADLYMVHDELRKSSGLEGHACFRCLEKAIVRQLVPSDFKDGVPANTDYVQHGPELRQRIGLA
ncbi:hypothetical protein IU486_31140 [Streptomyces gardneri]|uniref:hypothetical protein n=1 Tax=Nocardia TaxID=1817 RepID=UPI001358BB8E|nr:MULTISPECIES: hypothetical protein [Nocardia]MBF6169161.1 hypothetical protein [Streptomyces gardneri]MBF6206741.1 hypothetical protein [Streptomyces gardneri]